MNNPVAPPRSVPLAGAEFSTQTVDLYDVVDGDAVAPLVVVFVHGGGWYAGDRTQFAAWARHAAGRGYRSASLGYRTQEGSTYRDKVVDLTAGLRVVTDQWPDAGGVCLVGSSAGAHLVTALALGELGGAVGQVPVRAVVSANGPGSLRPESMLQAQERLNEMAMSSEEIALLDRPITEHEVGSGAVAADWLFLLAERETYFPYEHVAALAARLSRAGARTETVIVPDTDHGFVYGVLSGPAEAADLCTATLEAFWHAVAAGLADQADAAAASSHHTVEPPAT